MAFYDPATEGAPAIFVYALSTCVHCKAAKKLLGELGVEYGHVEVDLLPEDEMETCLDEMSQYNPSQSFPTLIIGGKVIVGDREDDIRQAVGKLKGAK